jgi:radical SAM protein with 4Fe4S-binding SPASM domain
MRHYLTFARLWNAFLALSSEYFSRIAGKPVVWGMPPVVSVEPSAFCNLHCPECPSGNGTLLRERGNMDFRLFEKLIEEIAPKSIAMQFFFQGEPFINPALTDMARLAARKKLYTIVSTNGHFLEGNADAIVEANIGKLIISLDGITQETYSLYRKGGNLNKVMRGIDELIAAKKQRKSRFPQLELQFVVFRHNEHQIRDFKLLCREKGIKGVLKTAQFYRPGQGEVLPPQNQRLSRYAWVAGREWILKREWHNACLRLWTNPVITWDGRICPCCYDKDARYSMGNLNNGKLADYWKSESFNRLRRQTINGRELPDMCRNCNR